MRYKTLITQKLQQVENGIKQLRYHAERGEMSDFRKKQEQLSEKLEEIHSLINTQDEQFN